MTLSALERLPAGREMDELVAERIFGLCLAWGHLETWYEGGKGGKGGTERRAWVWDDQGLPKHKGAQVRSYPHRFVRPGEDEWADELWPYSREMGFAKAVLDWLQAQATTLSLEWAARAGMWECCVLVGERDFTGAGETAPLALCRCALLVADRIPAALWAEP